jgi:Domain of unknown function (DUF305)
MMVPHHQGAIEMAQAELRYGHNEPLRRMAQEIIVTQLQEITGRGVDEVHRIRTDRDNRDGAMIRRKSHAMHQLLTLIEWTEIRGQRIAKADGANELVVDGIGDGDSVRVLFGGVDAIFMANVNIGIGSSRGSLSG